MKSEMVPEMNLFKQSWKMHVEPLKCVILYRILPGPIQWHTFGFSELTGQNVQQREDYTAWHLRHNWKLAMSWELVKSVMGAWKRMDPFLEIRCLKEFMNTYVSCRTRTILGPNLSPKLLTQKKFLTAKSSASPLINAYSWKKVLDNTFIPRAVPYLRDKLRHKFKGIS